MLTQEQVISGFSKRDGSFDGRDLNRLLDWFPVEQWSALGATLKEGADLASVPPPKPWTPESIIAQLRADVAFGFEKAIDKRGISASCMCAVVKMWMWVLEDDCLDHVGYAQYGLPMFKTVALKYGFPNEIGDDAGDEFKYSSECRD